MHIEPNTNFSEIPVITAKSIGRPMTLNDELAELVLSIEENTERPLFGSILLLDDAGKKLYRGAAPSLPESYCSQIDGIEVGPDVGSCGTAVYCGHPIYVVDIEVDSRWHNFKDAALAHGLKACWSMPIVGLNGKILGTFAVYYKVARSANDSERLLISNAAKEAATIIERYMSSLAA